MDFQENAKNNFDTEFIQNVQKKYLMEQNIKKHVRFIYRIYNLKCNN